MAVQEIKSTMKDLHIIMRILGSEWDYIVNDITDGTDGNSERSAYLFNSKRVRLCGRKCKYCWLHWPGKMNNSGAGT